jgi:hypothetical protein
MEKVFFDNSSFLLRQLPVGTLILDSILIVLAEIYLLFSVVFVIRSSAFYVRSMNRAPFPNRKVYMHYLYITKS